MKWDVLVVNEKFFSWKNSTIEILLIVRYSTSRPQFDGQERNGANY